MPGEPAEQWAPRVAEALRRMPAAVARDLRSWATEVRRQVRARAPRGDRGDLERSVDVQVTGDAGDARISVRSDDPAAQALEEGGPLIGKPWLAVPLSDGVRRRGSPRNDIELFSLVTPDGRVFLASRAGGALDVRWRLMRRVERKAKPFMRPTIEAAAKRLPRRLVDTMTREIGR